MNPTPEEETQHTATPWEQYGDVIWSPAAKANIGAVGDPHAGTSVGFTALSWSMPQAHRKEAYANAAYIVQACTAFHALVAALHRAEMKLELIAEYGLPGESADLCYRCMKDIAAEAARDLQSALKAAGSPSK